MTEEKKGKILGSPFSIPLRGNCVFRSLSLSEDSIDISRVSAPCLQGPGNLYFMHRQFSTLLLRHHRHHRQCQVHQEQPPPRLGKTLSDLYSMIQTSSDLYFMQEFGAAYKAGPPTQLSEAMIKNISRYLKTTVMLTFLKRRS